MRKELTSSEFYNIIDQENNKKKIGYKKDNIFTFEDIDFVDGIEKKLIGINNQSIFFKNCTFFKKTYLAFQFAIIAKLDKCIIIEQLFINDSHRIDDLSIEINNTEKTGDIIITNIQHLSFLKFNNSILNSIKLIDNVSINNNVLFENININTLEINRIQINAPFIISNESKIENFTIEGISGNEYRHLEIKEGVEINNCSIQLDSLNNTKILNSKINNLNLSGTINLNSIINIENTQFKKLQFKDVFNTGLISLVKLTFIKNNCISILTSNLGKSDFISCDFSEGIFEFENSKITEIFLSETKFPSSVHLKNKINHPQGQLAFGQLNTAFQKQGDTVNANECQSRETEAYYNSLKLKNNFFTVLNLSLNKLSNNFGRDWSWGILFTFTVGIIFFYFLILSTENYYFAFHLDCDPSLIVTFLKFINPLRFLETNTLFIDKKIELNNCSYVIDFVGRIFITYGYYQTIQAFRRFGRK